MRATLFALMLAGMFAAIGCQDETPSSATTISGPNTVTYDVPGMT